MSKTRKKAILVFMFFIVCLLKYYLFNVIEIFPLYGRENGLISWLVIVPVILTGCYLALNVIFSYLLKRHNARFIDLLLVLPILIFIIYFMFIK